MADVPMIRHMRATTVMALYEQHRRLAGATASTTSASGREEVAAEVSQPIRDEHNPTKEA